MLSIRKFVTRLFAQSIEGTEPHIVDLAEPICVVGLSMETNVNQIRRDVPALAKRYQQYKREQEILNLRQPWTFVAISKDFDPEMRTFWYMLGDVVISLDVVPPGLEPFRIPAIKYAVFPVRPKNRFGWPFAIASVKRYAFTDWLPNSRYEPAGVIDDFEYHDERSTTQKNPQIDLYIAIKAR